jgi:hypothetical protein
MVLDLGAAAAPTSSSPHARHGEVGTWRIGASLGLDIASGFTGFVIRPQASYTLLAFGPNLFFDLAGDLGLTFGSGCTGTVSLGGDLGQQPVCAEPGAKGSYQIYELVPAARLRWIFIPKFAWYSDLGLGLQVGHYSVNDQAGVEPGSETDFGVVIRLASGIRWEVANGIELLLEPVGLSFFLNGGHASSAFHYSATAGALFRL